MSEHYTGKLRAGRNGGFNQGPVNALFTAESDICGDLVASLNTIPISPTMEAAIQEQLDDPDNAKDPLLGVAKATLAAIRLVKRLEGA